MHVSWILAVREVGRCKMNNMFAHVCSACIVGSRVGDRLNAALGREV